MYLSDFHILQPPYTYSQEQGLELLAQLHLAADQHNESPFGEMLRERIGKVCCKQDKVFQRNTSAPAAWFQQPRLFDERSLVYRTVVDEALLRFYPTAENPPADMIHVTCTGYHSPSAAQKVVVQRGWEKNTLVTHAYHMGCMAAFPAIRMGMGSAALSRKRVDIIHTELCSLHLNPNLHSDEQLVIQSLFGDGLIKYSVSPKCDNKPSFQVLCLSEELIPHTEAKMVWECVDWGLKMTLAKEVPLIIGRHIVDFVNKLEKEAGCSLDQAQYAIHPGGPKIIDIIAKKLNLQKPQFESSEKILYSHGNMSSATLPHIWEAILKESRIPTGSLIVSLAFGPGLCMAGAVLRKVGQMQ